VGGLLVALALGIVFFASDESDQVVPQVQSRDSITTPQNSSTKALSNPVEVPTKAFSLNDASNHSVKGQAKNELIIDIARVKPDGSALVAGHAGAGALVSVFEGKILLGKTTADTNGEWVVVLSKLLGPGQHLISIGATLKDGTTVMANTSIAVEIYDDHNTKPMVALLPESQTDIPVLLQSPDDYENTKDSHIPPGKLAVISPRSLSWQDKTLLTIAGQSRGGVRVLVSVNGKSFGDAFVTADSAWQVNGALEKGTRQYLIEFILVDSNGQAVATYTLPVDSGDLQKGLDGSQLVIVNKGDALWRIAYRTYGKGVRYVDIVRKNTGDIQNPDLIYPNQIFTMPKTTLND
jgi:hypothetical protein